MKLKQSLCIIAAAVAAISLSGCISTPKQREAEYQANRLTTLRVHADNRVGMKTDHEWMWTTGASSILAIEVGRQVYNIKDVAAVFMDTDSSITLKMVNGDVARGEVKSSRWLSCSVSKVCNSEVPVGTGRHYQDKLGENLKYIPASVLRDPSSFKYGRTDEPDNPRNAIRTDSVAAPQLLSAGARVTVLSQAELDTLTARVATIVDEWDAKAPQRAAAAKQREVEQVAATQRRLAVIKNARIGTSWHCERNTLGELHRGAGLTCPNVVAQYSIDEFVVAGWNVENISSMPGGLDGIGRTTVRYSVSVRKAQ